MGEAPFRGFPTYRFLAPPLTLSVQKNGKCAEKDKCHWTVRGPTQGLGADVKWMVTIIHLTPGSNQPAVHTFQGGPPKG